MDPSKTLVNIAGGEELTVIHLDGRNERVTVRALHIKQFPKLMRAMGDECAQAEIFCGKDPGWGETLTNKSVIEVYQLGHKLNESFFVEWSQRRMQEQERLVPGITKRLTGGLQSSPSEPISDSPKL